MFLPVVSQDDVHLRDFEVQVVCAAEAEQIVLESDVLEASVQRGNQEAGVVQQQQLSQCESHELILAGNAAVSDPSVLAREKPSWRNSRDS